MKKHSGAKSRLVCGALVLSTLAAAWVCLPAVGQPGKDDKNPKDGPVPVQTLKGHKDAVFTLAFTPDGKFVITGSLDNTLKMWDASTGQEVRTFDGPAGHSKLVACAAISKDGHYLASGSVDNTLKLWDVPSSSPLREFAAKEAVNAVALSGDGKKLATALKDGLIKVWNAEDGKELFTLKGHAGAVRSVAFSANNATIGSCDDKGVVRFWSAADGKATGEIGAHGGAANNMVFNQNNATAYTVGQDGTLRAWAVATPLPRALPGHAQPILTTALSADGAQVVSASADKVTRVTTFANGQTARTLADVGAPVTAAAFNGNASQVVGGTQDGRFVVWNNTDGKVVTLAQAHDGPITGVSLKAQNDQAITAGADGLLKLWTLPLPAGRSFAHPDEVLAAAWKSDGSKFYTGGKDKLVRSWLLQNGQMEKQFAGHAAPVTAVALSPNGQLLASGSDDATIRLWNPADAKEIGQLGGHEGRITSLVFNAAGTHLYSAGADGTVRYWQVPPPAPKSLAQPDQVTTLALTPDGNSLITGGADKTVRVWNLGKATKEKDLQGFAQAVAAVGVSGNGQFVIGGSGDKSAIVWKLADGKEVKKLASLAPVTAVALDVEGKVAAIGQNNSAIQLVNVADGKEVKQLSGHKGPITGVVYTAKGDQLISASADKTVKVWDVADGSAKTTLEHVAPVSCVALSKDGAHVAAGAGKSIKVWKLADGKEVTNIVTKGDVRTLSFSPAGEIVAAGEADNAARVYSLSGKLTITYSQGAPVNAVVFSNDGKSVIAAGADKQTRIWTSPLVWQVATGPVHQLALNGKANQLVVAGDDKSLRILNGADGKEIKAIPAHDGKIVGVAVSGDGSKLVSAGADKAVKLWSLVGLDKAKEIKPTVAITLKGEPQSVSLSADGNRIAVAVSEDKANRLRVFDAGSGKEMQSFQESKAPIPALAFHPDNKTILAASADKNARLDTIGVVAILPGHAGGVSSVQYHTNGTQALSAGADKTVKLWDLAKGNVVKTYGPVEGPVQQATFSKDSAQIAAGAGKSVLVWNTADGKEVAKLDHPAKVSSVSISADKSRVVTSCEDKQTRVWDLAGKAVLEFFHQEEPNANAIFHPAGTSVVFASGKSLTAGSLGIQRYVAASPQPLHALAMAPNGTHVLAGGADKEVKFWNMTNGKAEKSFGGATATIYAVAIAPNGALVATGGADKTIRLYTLADAKEVKSESVPGEVHSLRFSPNSQLLLGACGKNSIIAWDALFTPGQPVPSGLLKTVQVFNHADQPTDVVVAGDNATVYSGSADKTARAWRLASPSPKVNLPHPGNVMAVAFSPNNKLFASAATDGKVRVYDMDKKALVKEINAHPTKDQTQIYALAFSPDSQNIASAGMDRDVKIHNATSGALVKEIKGYKAKDAENGHKDTINSLAFSPDGKTLATGSAGLERVIKLWNVADGGLVRTLDNPQIKKGKFRTDPQSHPGWVYSMSFTKDGKHLLSAGNAPKNRGYLAVWKVEDGSLVSGQELPLGVFYGLAISPDESMIAVGAGALGTSAPDFNCAYLFKMPSLK